MNLQDKESGVFLLETCEGSKTNRQLQSCRCRQPEAYYTRAKAVSSRIHSNYSCGPEEAASNAQMLSVWFGHRTKPGFYYLLNSGVTVQYGV